MTVLSENVALGPRFRGDERVVARLSYGTAISPAPTRRFSASRIL